MKKFNFLENLLRREFAMSGMRGMNGLRADAVNPDSLPTVNRQSRLTSVQRHDSVTSARVAQEWLNGSTHLRVCPLKIVAVLAILLTIGVGQMWGANVTGTFSKITSTSNLTTGYYIIVASESASSNTKAVGASVDGNKRIAGVSVTITSGTTISNPDAATVYLITKNNTNYTFYNVSTSKYLYQASTTSGKGMGFKAASANITCAGYNSSSPIGFKFTLDGASNNIFKWNNGSSWFANYSGAYSTSMTPVRMFKAYKVTYDGNGNTGGSVPTDATYYSGNGSTSVTVKSNSGSLTKTSYTFAGWNTKADGTGTNYTAGSGTFTITANTTLYAKWESAGTSVSLTKAASSNGSFTLTQGGSAVTSVTTTSAAQTVTVTGSPSAGYYLSNVTQSGASATPTITKTSATTYTIQYAKGCSGTSTITATFSPIWYLKGDFNSWGTTDPLTNITSNVATVTKSLSKTTAYEFKVYNAQEDAWYGNNGKIIDDISGWTFSTSEGNCKVFATVADDYTFKYNISTKAMQVEYPDMTHPNDAYVYLTKWWDCYVHYWYTDGGGDHALSSWGSDLQLSRYEEICETDYWCVPILDGYPKLIMKDKAGDPSNTTGDQTTASNAGKYITHNGSAWVWNTFGTYTITFVGNGNTGGSMSDVNGICPGGSTTLVANGFTKTGYSFSNWKTNVAVTANGNAVAANGNVPGAATLSSINTDITLTAQWSANTISLTLNKNNSDASGSNNGSASIKYNATALESGTTHATRTGYTLEGYYAEAGCTNKVMTNAGVLVNYSGYVESGKWVRATSPTTLYAKWTPNNYTVTWHVGDDDSNTSTVAYNTEFQNISVGKPSVANNDLSSCGSNYFVGWVKASGVRTADGGTVSQYNDNKVNATDKITGDTHFYAMFATQSAGSPTSEDLTSSELTTNITNTQCSYGTEKKYTDNSKIAYAFSCYTDAASRPWVQLKKADATAYIEIEAPGNITQVDLTITAAENSSGGITDISKHTKLPAGTSINLNTGKVSDTSKRVAYVTGDGSNTSLSINVSSPANKKLYLQATGGACRIWGIKVYYSETSYSNYRTGCVATCGVPTSLTSSEITKTGAKISWTGSATGTLDHYEYAYWIDGEDEPTSGFTNNSKNTSATLSGLYSSVKYNWKVRQVCTGDDNSNWVTSYFTTNAANLTYSVPDGVSAVSTPATTAGNMNTADVPTSCGSCWAFAGWTTAEYPDNSAAPANLFPAGTKARVSGDATLYAVYSRIEYKMIGETTGLVANDNYVLTLATTAGDEFAMSNEAQETYTYEIARTDVTDRCHEYVDGFYVYNVGANNIWKFTGTASSGQLYNAAADKYINLSSTAGSTTSMLGTSDNLTFTADGVYWTIHSTKYLHPYSASGGGWEAVASGSWDAAEDFSGYLYHQNDATYSTAPGCGTYSVTWKVAGSEYTTGTPTTSTNTCTGVEALPTNPADNALGCADVFRGWSESELTGTGNGAPSDLFDYAGDAPDIDENTVFHAVFATVASGSVSTTTHTMNNSGTINSNWEGNGRTQKADSYASKAAWQMMGYSSDANPEGELNTKSTYTNVAGVTINVAASNATTVTLYYSANKSSWTEVSAVKVSKNSSSYTDYSFNFSSMPKTAVYLKLVNSTNSLYVYQVKITTDSRTFNNYTTYCTNVYNDATNDHKWSTTGNWSNGHVPTINERASIQKPVTVDVQTAKAKNVMLMQNSTNTGQLIIDAGNELTVAETVRKTTDGSTDTSTGENDIIFNSNEDDGLGALVMGTHDGTNKATVNFYTKSNGKKQQNTSVAQYVGTPFNDETNILYNWYNSWIYKLVYDESGNIDWERVNEGYGMDPFKGYCVFSADAWDNDAGHSYWMQGTLVTSANHMCAGLNWQSGSGTANLNNENLLANSWMAPIKIDSMKTTDFVNANATIYIFNSTSNSAYKDLAGNYDTYTIKASDGAVIPAMQSFSVFTTNSGASVTLDYNKIVYEPAVAGTATPTANKAPRRAGASEAEADKMRLFVRTEDGYGDMVYMWEREDFAEGFENGWDGHKLFGESYAPQLYAITPDGEMAVNCVPSWEGTVLGFKKGTEDNVYTFTFEYEGENTWYLNDLKAEQSTRILSGNTYAFSTASGDMEARFIISAMPISKVPTSIENGEAGKNVHKLLIDGILYIIRNGRMYDATGVMIK